MSAITESDEEIWEENYDSEDKDGLGVSICDEQPSLPTFSVETSPNAERAQVLFRWFVGFLLLLQARYYIPNSALTVLVKFLYAFFSILGPFSPLMNCISRIFPKSYYHLLETVGCDGQFTKYIVCTKCRKLYKCDDAVEKCGTTLKSKCCSHILYPNVTSCTLQSVLA